MIDRRFNEIDLRTMLEAAYDYQFDIQPDRWVILCYHDSKECEVIVHPFDATRTLIVITAYAVN